MLKEKEMRFMSLQQFRTTGSVYEAVMTLAWRSSDLTHLHFCDNYNYNKYIALT